jgi:1-acyl-sn-glycerol-3-phosphate acyltransferase
MPWVMRLVSAVCFRGIHGRHLERFPARGAALVVANHPATWTDVLVLEVALVRRLHFLAHETLFRPRPRAWLLRLYGALPVAKRGDAPGREARNAATFRACRRLLDRGEVVAIFPEGVSAQEMGRFKTGAARLALEGLARSRPAPLIPVGIHYADRTAFRTRVVVSVGRTAVLHPPPDERDAESWIAALTRRLEAAVGNLVLDLRDPALRAAVEELAPLVPGRPTSDPAAFERARRVARRLSIERRERPERYAEILRHARRHRRLRERLRLEPRDLGERARAPAATLAVATLLGAAPAVAGLALNALPAWFTSHHVRSYTDPTRVALVRIVAGSVAFAVWYVALTAALAYVVRPRWAAAAGPPAAAVLGGFALAWIDGWREIHGRLRFAMIARFRPRALARLRRERAVLRRWIAAGSPNSRPREQETIP